MSSAHKQTRRSDSESDLDRVFHALSHRVRRSLLNALAGEPKSITELAEPFDMSFPAVSKHIRVLEGAGLLVRKIDGRVHECRFNATSLRDAKAWIEHYSEFWESSLDSLAKHFRKEKDE